MHEWNQTTTFLTDIKKHLKTRGLTCTDAHYESGYDDDLVGIGGLTDPLHHGGDDGEDVVEEEGALPVRGTQFRSKN